MCFRRNVQSSRINVKISLRFRRSIYRSPFSLYCLDIDSLLFVLSFGLTFISDPDFYLKFLRSYVHLRIGKKEKRES